MGLLDKISKSLVDYVSLADLVGFLSEYQNETIHSIALYLSHYNFYDTPNYSITVDNKFYENDLDNFGNEIHWIEPKNIIDNLIKEFVFFDTTVSRGMMAEMTFSKIRHYLSKMDGVEINNKQYLAIEKLYRANVHYKKSDLLELDFLAEYLQDNQEFKEWKTSYIRPFSYYDNQWYITEPANQPTDPQQENERLQARIAELEQQLAKKNSTPANLPCFDENDVYTYPPELDMAVKIWTEIYQTDHLPKHLSHHSDKFRQACKNLGFSFAENAVETRLKKVTTPQNQKEKTKNKNH